MFQNHEFPSALLHEGLVSPDAPRFQLKQHLTISGEAFTGKSTIATLLGGLLDTTVQDGKGRINRRKEGTITAAGINLATQHSEVDAFTRESFRTSREREIWEMRLAAINAAEEQDRIDLENHRIALQRQNGDFSEEFIPSLPVFSVLITADEGERIDRAYEAHRFEAARIGLPEPGLKEVISAIHEKEQRDIRSWSVDHPYYVKAGESPFNPDLRRPNGAPVYHYRIDNSGLTILQTALEIYRILPAFGAAEKRPDAPNLDLGLITN